MTAGLDLRALRAAVFAAVCVSVSAAGHILAAGTGVPAVTLVLGFAAAFAVALPLAGRERTLPGIASLLALGQLGLHLLFSCGQGAQGHMSAAGGHRPGGSGGGGNVRDLARSLLCGDAASGMTDAQAHRVVTQAGLPADGAGHAAHASGQAAGAGALPDTPLDCLRDAARAALGLLDAPMLLGHLLAALLLGWTLRRGEAALWRLVRLSAELAASADEVVAARALRAALAYVRALHAGLLPHAPVSVAFTAERDARTPCSVTLQHSVHRRGPPAVRADSLTLAA
ncbi:hypothetical protein GCM10009801_08790 [Streptomyces albiaxialis]|uniref:Integral membrane protein n=1 Tax=Streptomyces albiaxialis TaxID=329523 RepID=A0ABP5H8U6_9ACTN